MRVQVQGRRDQETRANQSRKLTNCGFAFPGALPSTRAAPSKNWVVCAIGMPGFDFLSPVATVFPAPSEMGSSGTARGHGSFPASHGGCPGVAGLSAQCRLATTGTHAGFSSSFPSLRELQKPRGQGAQCRRRPLRRRALSGSPGSRPAIWSHRKTAGTVMLPAVRALVIPYR
jgi:hypothetical protein